MPRIRFSPTRARETPESIPRDAEDRAPVLEQDSPDRPEAPGDQGRVRRWGRAGGAALTLAAAGGALAWGLRRRNRDARPTEQKPAGER